jgi:hypothetical protein
VSSFDQTNTVLTVPLPGFVLRFAERVQSIVRPSTAKKTEAVDGFLPPRAIVVVLFLLVVRHGSAQSAPFPRIAPMILAVIGKVKRAFSFHARASAWSELRQFLSTASSIIVYDFSRR